jgi:transcriptional regulator with XRE-family HTH domain
METGKRIRDLRLKKGMTQEELARQTELSTRTIQRIENGEVDPRAYTLQMIATALGVEYDIFLLRTWSLIKNQRLWRARQYWHSYI